MNRCPVQCQWVPGDLGGVLSGGVVHGAGDCDRSGPTVPHGGPMSEMYTGLQALHPGTITPQKEATEDQGRLL